MNAFTILLILSIIINTVFIVALFINMKYIKKLIKEINDKNIFYNPYLSDDKYANFKENAFNSHIIYKDNNEQVMEENNIEEYEVFDNISDFINYVAGYNLNVLNIETGKVRTIKYLEELNFPDTTVNNFLITFEDGSRDVFKPNIYAKYISNC